MLTCKRICFVGKQLVLYVGTFSLLSKLLVQRIYCLYIQYEFVSAAVFMVPCVSLHCSIFVSRWQRWPQIWWPQDCWSAMQPRPWTQGPPHGERCAAWLNCRLQTSASASVTLHCSFMEAMATSKITLCSSICETAECTRYWRVCLKEAVLVVAQSFEYKQFC